MYLLLEEGWLHHVTGQRVDWTNEPHIIAVAVRDGEKKKKKEEKIRRIEG